MKECFGNYMESNICKGHNSCNENENCFMKTSTEKGPCDCEYKCHCHVPRQEAQIYLQSIDDDKKEDCTFYEMFIKDKE